MRIIPLTKNQVAIVDDDDFEKLNSRKWRAQFSPTLGGYYAVRSYMENGKYKVEHMHRAVMGLGNFKQDPITVDHLNHNSLDNRKENLALKSVRDNSLNRKSGKKSASDCPGVCFHKALKKWVANVYHKKRQNYLGLFHTEEEAIEAVKGYWLNLGQNHDPNADPSYCGTV